MPFNFSQQGSTSGNPTAGLLGNSNFTGVWANPKKPKIPVLQGTGQTGPLSGFGLGQTSVPNIQNATSPSPFAGGSPLATIPAYHEGEGIVPLTPVTAEAPATATQGLLDQHKPTGKVAKIKDNQGNEVHFDNTQTTTTTTEPTSPKAGATQMDRANAVIGASQPTALSTGATNAAALYGMLGNERQLQPFAGGTTQGLDQSYANLTRPQSTGNFAGEAGLFDVQKGILQNASQQTAANALAQQGLATQGATSVLQAGAPQFGVQPGTLVGQPLEAGGGIDQNYLGGIQAPANIRSVQDFTSQVNNTQKSIDTLHNFASAIIPNMGTVGFNPMNTPVGNQTFSKYFENANPAAAAGIKAGLGEIKNQISNVIASATGLTPTGVTSVTDSYDFTALSPKQLNDFLLYIDSYAKMNIDAAQKSIDRIKTGGSANTETGPLPAPSANSVGLSALGTGATAAQSLISQIISKAGNVVSGAIGGGIAAKILQ